MKRFVVILFAVVFAVPVFGLVGADRAYGQTVLPLEQSEAARDYTKKKRDMRFQYSPRDVSHYDFVVEGGDTLTVVYVNRVICFSRPINMRRYWKIVRDFRVVYPLAQIAKVKMAQFEAQILAQPTRKAQREVSRRIEKSLVQAYEPTMRRMTVNQGKILVRLIDRETNNSSYEIIRTFRGGFVAGFWQGIARLFGHNLKDEYDPTERDRVIEQCIILYELGLLPEY